MESSRAAFAESALNSPYFSRRHSSVTHSAEEVLSSPQAHNPKARQATGNKYFLFFITNPMFWNREFGPLGIHKTNLAGTKSTDF